MYRDVEHDQQEEKDWQAVGKFGQNQQGELIYET